jgi:serine/threonine-protein kinase
VKEQAADARVPAGAVLSQTPLAQSRVTPNAEVSVVLSTGPAKRQVPMLVGQKLEQAKAALEQAGLTLGPINEAAEGDPGIVAATVPPAGTELDPGAAVVLSVPQAKAEVPKLRGLHITKAREAIKKAKLTVGDVSQIYDKNRRGYLVLTQEPDAGARVALGSPVNLVVNQGD